MKKRTINLPVLIRKEIGLGDAVKKVTAAVGIKPCASCARRAEKLNSAIRFTPLGAKRQNHG
jgi:hypothetical protein